MTHDIGSVMLLKSIGDIAPGSMAFDSAELLESLVDVNTSFGAAILKDLGFGGEFADVVTLHKWSSFQAGTRKEVLIVNLAEQVATNINYGFFASAASLSGHESANILGIGDETLAKVAENVKAEMKDIELVFI